MSSWTRDPTSDRLVKRTNPVAATTPATPIATRSHPCPQQTGAVSRNAGLGAPLPSLASNPNDTTQRGPLAFEPPNAPTRRGRPSNTITTSAAINATSLNPSLAGPRVALSMYDRMLATIRPSANIASAVNPKLPTLQAPNLVEGTSQLPHTCTLGRTENSAQVPDPSSSSDSISDATRVTTNACTRTTGRRSPLVLLARLFDEPLTQSPRPSSVVVETTGTSTTPQPETSANQTSYYQVPTLTSNNDAATLRVISHYTANGVPLLQLAPPSSSTAPLRPSSAQEANPLRPSYVGTSQSTTRLHEARFNEAAQLSSGMTRTADDQLASALTASYRFVPIQPTGPHPSAFSEVPHFVQPAPVRPAPLVQPTLSDRYTSIMSHLGNAGFNPDALLTPIDVAASHNRSLPPPAYPARAEPAMSNYEAAANFFAALANRQQRGSVSYMEQGMAPEPYGTNDMPTHRQRETPPEPVLDQTLVPMAAPQATRISGRRHHAALGNGSSGSDGSSGSSSSSSRRHGHRHHRSSSRRRNERPHRRHSDSDNEGHDSATSRRSHRRHGSDDGGHSSTTSHHSHRHSGSGEEGRHNTTSRRQHRAEPPRVDNRRRRSDSSSSEDSDHRRHRRHDDKGRRRYDHRRVRGTSSSEGHSSHSSAAHSTSTSSSFSRYKKSAVKPPRPQQFSGKPNDLITWLDSYEVYAEAADLNPAEWTRQALPFMPADTRDYLQFERYSKRGKLPSFLKFKELLINQLLGVDPETLYMRMLDEMVQSPTESLLTYGMRFRKMLKLINMSTVLVKPVSAVTKFIAGLRDPQTKALLTRQRLSDRLIHKQDGTEPRRTYLDDYIRLGRTCESSVAHLPRPFQ